LLQTFYHVSDTMYHVIIWDVTDCNTGNLKISMAAVAFCYEHKCELLYIHPGHDVKLHPHRVKLYQIGCVGSGLVLARALT